MRNVWIIAKREFNAYMSGPIAYAIAFVILLTLGIFFYLDVLYAIQTMQFVPDIQRTLTLMVFPLIFLAAPAITMRSLAEENRNGTLELLLTAPLRDWELVVGKWLGSFMYFVMLTAITWVFPLLLNMIVQPGIDQGAMLSGYLGVLLLTGTLCAIGVFASSLFSNQIASFFVAIGIIIILWVIAAPADTTQGIGADLLRYLSLTEHFYPTMAQGVIEIKDLVYYLSMTSLALFLGTMTVEARRWR